MKLNMPRRSRSSGGSGDPDPGEPPAKRTRFSSKSPGTSPPKPKKPKNKPKGSKRPKKPELVTLEAKPEHWLNKLPDNHGMSFSFS